MGKMSYPKLYVYLLHFTWSSDESDDVFKGEPTHKHGLGHFKEIFFL